MTQRAQTIRHHLLAEVGRFVERARAVRGVRRVALIGSLATEKREPKDADLLVWIDDDADVPALAAAGRQLKGRAQGWNCGADIFLAGPDNRYLGRICHWRVCQRGIRATCLALHCGARPHVCDDFTRLTLPRSVIDAPPLDLWPVVVRRQRMPEDVDAMLLEGVTWQPAAAPDCRAH